MFFFVHPADVDAGAAAASSLPLRRRGEVGGPQAVPQRGPGYRSAAGHPKCHPRVGPQREGPVQVRQIRADAPGSRI